MKTNALLISLLLIGCSTANYDEPPQRSGTRRERPRPMMSGPLDMLPPPYWWRAVGLADGLNLSNEQVADLERVYPGDGDEAARLERDRMTAVRDIQRLLDSDRPSARDVTEAGQRLRALDDTLFERQLRMLVAVRQILSREQWERLQRNLDEERQPMRQREGRGGFGGGRRGGRRPGRP